MSLLTHDTIGILKEAKTPEDCIIAAGEYLEKGGYITNDYTKAMIKNFEINGPYFVLAPALAMPHARPTDGVLKNGISLITLKTPVNFGSENDPVKVVLALATSSSDEHLEYMSKIAMALREEDIIERIYHCQSIEEMMNII